MSNILTSDSFCISQWNRRRKQLKGWNREQYFINADCLVNCFYRLKVSYFPSSFLFTRGRHKHQQTYKIWTTKYSSLEKVTPKNQFHFLLQTNRMELAFQMALLKSSFFKLIPSSPSLTWNLNVSLPRLVKVPLIWFGSLTWLKSDFYNVQNGLRKFWLTYTSCTKGTLNLLITCCFIGHFGWSPWKLVLSSLNVHGFLIKQMKCQLLGSRASMAGGKRTSDRLIFMLCLAHFGQE